MAQAQQVERPRKKKETRWMHGARREKVLEVLGQSAHIALQAGVAFLLSFADVMGIPSGLQAAWLTALSAAGESLLWPLCGCALAFPMRLLWHISPRWETLITLGLMALAPRVVFRQRPWRISGWTALSLVPCLAVALAGGVPADILLALATMATGTLAAPVMLRALQVIRGGEHVIALEERVAVGYTAALILAGGGRLMLFFVNLGALGAVVMTVYAGMCLGAGAGCIMGLVGGLVLAMQGLPLTLSVCLAMGGFLGGLVQWRERRRLVCFSFLAACLLTMLLAGVSALSCAPAAVVGAVAVALLPEPWDERVRALFLRFRCERSDTDAYCGQLLTRWEQTVAAMAEAVPQARRDQDPHDGAWWRERLCAGCPDAETCDAVDSDTAAHRAEEVLDAYAAPDEMWAQALENLRGLGCGRLYFLRERMEQLRDERRGEDRQLRRAAYEREMLTTHLTAMAGAARHFALLSVGGTWWDAANARALRQAASERAVPAALMYARRLSGHAQVAWELRPGAPERLPEELRALTSRALEMPMEITACQDDRLYLGERPPFRLEVGTATRGMQPDEEQNGDAFYLGALEGGTSLVVLSDGMGHGKRAREESAQTVALMRLCLEAGYTRAQALTAVNGLMLSVTQGERFATVDLLTVNLWNGSCTLDKLGAAGSWLKRGGELTQLTGEALPLGILEEVASRTSTMKLRPGDALVLLTDGVEDAFSDSAQLEMAIRQALREPSAQSAASALLEATYNPALLDDRTVLVAYLVANRD